MAAMITERMVREFLAVAEARSFTKAAEKLRMAQPRMSSRIRELEGCLGYTVFDRSRRRISLTEEGEALVELAKHFVNEAEHFRKSSLAIAMQKRTTVRIGSPLVLSGVPERDRIIDLLTDRFPHLNIKIETMKHPDLEHAISQGVFDIGFIMDPLPPSSSPDDYLIIGRQNALILIPEEWPEAEHETFRLESLSGRSIATLPSVVNPDLCRKIFGGLNAAGLHVIEVPEISFGALISFAARRRVAALSADSMAETIPPSSRMVGRRPPEAFFGSNFYLVRPAADAAREAHQLWKMVGGK
jgi:DNA-binding transcriptional LysR family regulator